MRIYTTDYSALALNHTRFKALVTKLANDIPALAKALGADAIAVRGTSGYSVAFAMRMLTDFPMIIARKPGESSHGSSISAFNNGSAFTTNRYVILDDLIYTGNTVRGMVEDLSAVDLDGRKAQCVGIVEYSQLIGMIPPAYDGEPLKCTPKLTGRSISAYTELSFEDFDDGVPIWQYAAY